MTDDELLSAVIKLIDARCRLYASIPTAENEYKRQATQEISNDVRAFLLRSGKRLAPVATTIECKVGTSEGSGFVST